MRKEEEEDQAVRSSRETTVNNEVRKIAAGCRANLNH